MLFSRTPSAWIDCALGDMDAVLVDHAHCEKKAAASAMSLVSGYPDHDELVRRLSGLAVEELQHFRAVYARIAARGLELGRDPGDPYAQRLLSLVRPQEGRLTDRLLAFGLIEARSHERLALLGEHLDDPALAGFYRELATAEERHAEMFQELACLYEPAETVLPRLRELAEREAEIVASLPVLPRVH